MIVQKTVTGNKLYGQTMGIVKQINTDGTYKVWIPGVYDAEYSEKFEKLPNAKLLYPAFLGDTTDWSFSAPLLIGTKVFCFFDNGEISKPVIIGKYLSEETYQALANKAQNSFIRQLCLRLGKSSLTMKENGNMELCVLKESTDESAPISKIIMDENGDISITARNIDINASGDFNLRGLTIKLFSIFSMKLIALTNIITESLSMIIRYKNVVKTEDSVMKNLYTIFKSKFYASYQTILAGWWGWGFWRK